MPCEQRATKSRDGNNIKVRNAGQKEEKRKRCARGGAWAEQLTGRLFGCTRSGEPQKHKKNSASQQQQRAKQAPLTTTTTTGRKPDAGRTQRTRKPPNRLTAGQPGRLAGRHLHVMQTSRIAEDLNGNKNRGKGLTTGNRRLLSQTDAFNADHQFG